MRILVCMPVTDEHKLWLFQAAPGEIIDYMDSETLTENDVRDADVIIGNPPLQLLESMKNLRLLQLNSAGTGGYTRLAEVRPQAALCCATGSYGLAISEHMLGVLLMLMKKLALYRDQQFSGDWRSLGFVDSISGAEALCVGMGDIGSSFAKRLHALGALVTGVRRSPGDTPDFCRAVITTAELDAYLPNADIVALSMPETPETCGMFNEKRISLMKKGSYLLNVGRGSAIDQDALLSALREGRIAGAALDVTSPEPLPPEHPLWKEPNCVITPHVSGGFRLPETHSRIIRLACRNLRALMEDKPLESIVDPQTGYRAR